jgi:hypothetical protein
MAGVTVKAGEVNALNVLACHFGSSAMRKTLKEVRTIPDDFSARCDSKRLASRPWLIKESRGLQ